MIPLIDAHLDLAWNALSFDRDLTLSLAELNRRERHMTDAPFRGRATVCLPELHAANVAVCIATLLARSGPVHKLANTYKRIDLDYGAPAIASAHAHGQRAYYRYLESHGLVRILRTSTDLEAHWNDWSSDRGSAPLGVILSMEGCDPILRPDDAEAWWDAGLRAAGLTHYGIGQYGHGTGSDGSLAPAALLLLKEFNRLGIALDVTHLTDLGMRQVLEAYEGRILASHHNCRSLVPGQRQLTDDQIRLLIERDAVIGMSMDAWMLQAGWVRGVSRHATLSLEVVADHMDHICQLAGSARHCAIGSDLDGGFGANQTPQDLETVADLQRLGGILKCRGYTTKHIELILHGNWLRFFGEALPTR